MNRRFKDWTMPGPLPAANAVTMPPDLNEDSANLGPITCDALAGLWKIYQYERGHRYSTDDVLTAWYGTTHVPSAARVLDLGSGIGSVGMLAAWRLTGAKFVTVEAQNISTRLARASARYNGLTERYKILDGDLRDSQDILNTAGETAPFDLVLGSPPYFPLGTGVTGEHPQTIPCRFEVRGDIADYCLAAARHLGPGGVFAFVFPTEQIERALSTVAQAGLRAWSRTDVIFREGNAPLVSLFSASRSTDLPETFAKDRPIASPALMIRQSDGRVSPDYQKIKFTMGFRP